jgi:flagellar assembly protein FliH
MASSERAQSMPPAAQPTSPSSSERVIAADRVVDVRRWTIGGFDAAVSSRPPEASRVRAEHLPTVDEVADIERQAREEGYRAGLAEAREGNQRVTQLLAGVGTSVARMEREMAQSLVKLAIDLARQVVRESIAARPEMLVPVVTEALSGLARSADPGGLYVNPADLALVEERLGDALAHGGWKAFADDRVERGGCRIEFTGGQVDATIATRWTRVMGQLERNDAWLD